MRSFLGVPIVVRGQAYGNLYLAEKEGGEFDEADEEAVTILAEWAAVTIFNVRLYSQSEEERGALERAVHGARGDDRDRPRGGWARPTVRASWRRSRSGPGRWSAPARCSSCCATAGGYEVVAAAGECGGRAGRPPPDARLRRAAGGAACSRGARHRGARRAARRRSGSVAGRWARSSPSTGWRKGRDFYPEDERLLVAAVGQRRHRRRHRRSRSPRSGCATA